MQRVGKRLIALSLRSVPAFHPLSRPRGSVLAMASGAGVGHPQAHRQVWARNAHTVIVALIYDHVSARWHVAGRALGGLGSGCMMMMRLGVVFLCEMALNTHGITTCAQL